MLLTKLSLYVHILAGLVGILFFWILVFKKKGTSSHEKMGQIFYYSLIVVCFTSVLNGAVYLISEVVFGQKNHPHLGYGVVMILQGLISLLPVYYGQLALKSIQIFPDQRNLGRHTVWLSILVVYVIINQVYAIKLNYFLLQFYSFTVAPLTIFLCMLYIFRMKKRINSRKELLTSHILFSVVAGIDLHVGFLVGGFSTKFLMRLPSNIEYAATIFGIILLGVIYIETLRRRLK